METWELLLTFSAGFITIFTLLEKLGITTRVKKVDADFNEMRKMVTHVAEVNLLQQELIVLQKDQNNAILAILRNELYQSFRRNRDIGVWTDDEFAVQTKLHEAYQALHGNGEETVWWDKKKSWRIVSNEEYNEILNEYYKC